MSRDRLKQVILSNNISALKVMIQAGSDPNLSDSCGVVPLFHAINFGTAEAMRILIDAGANVNHTDANGKSPWFLAVESRDMKKIHLLEEYHADATIQNSLGHNAIHLTSMRGDLRLFHYLIHHSPQNAILAVNRWGDTLLHLAVSWHHINLVRICLTHTSININAENVDGETPFMKAVKGNDLKIAKLLFESGCDCNIPDKRKFNPVTASVKFVSRNQETFEFISSLLQKGVLPDIVNSLNETALWLAAKTDWTEMAEELMKYQVNVNHVGKDENAPIHLAYQNGNMSMLKTLLRHKANPDLVKNKKTLLLEATGDSNTEAAELLLAAGADPSFPFRDEDNKTTLTPILIAAKKRYTPMIQLLQQYIAKTDQSERQPPIRK